MSGGIVWVDIPVDREFYDLIEELDRDDPEGRKKLISMIFVVGMAVFDSGAAVPTRDGRVVFRRKKLPSEVKFSMMRTSK